MKIKKIVLAIMLITGTFSHYVYSQDIENKEEQTARKPSKNQLDALKSLMISKKSKEDSVKEEVTTPKKTQKNNKKEIVRQQSSEKIRPNLNNDKANSVEQNKVQNKKEKEDTNIKKVGDFKVDLTPIKVLRVDDEKTIKQKLGMLPKEPLPDPNDTKIPAIINKDPSPVEAWKPIQTITGNTPKIKRVENKEEKPQSSYDPTSPDNVDKFFGIDDIQKENSKEEVKVAPAPKGEDKPLTNVKPVIVTPKKEEPVKNTTDTPSNGFFNSSKIGDALKDFENKNGIKNKDSDKKASNKPVNNKNLFADDEAQIVPRYNNANIPLLDNLAKNKKPPKAIQGAKIDRSLLGKEVYLRLFKKEHTLELYLKQGSKFVLANSYDICTFSGGLGPKKRTGDHKSPEGFYQVNAGHLQPNSKYYKAINIGFPNAYDRSKGYSGQFLMIHGACVSIGCYAMTDKYIKEIYEFTAAAMRNGQTNVDINIYPFRMTERNLKSYSKDPNYNFWKQLQPGYQYFEVTGLPPKVSVQGGEYVVNTPLGFKENLPEYVKNN